MRLVSDRQTLSRAKPEALRRLARFVGVGIPDAGSMLRPGFSIGCRCSTCTRELVEVLARRLLQ